MYCIQKGLNPKDGGKKCMLKCKKCMLLGACAASAFHAHFVEITSGDVPTSVENAKSKEEKGAHSTHVSCKLRICTKMYTLYNTIVTIPL